MEGTIALTCDWWGPSSVWRQKHCCPVPLSHPGCEFTCCRRRQFSASTFGRRRKSVWFEVVCGSPSCGSGGAHSSQCQCASLEGDQKAHGRCCCCCRLAIKEASALPQQTKLTPISALPELIVKYGHWAAPGLFFPSHVCLQHG